MPSTQAASHHEPPRYFHLLWDEDLDDLRDVLTAIRDRRAEVVTTWYELYQLHFGDRRALSEGEFRNIFEPALLRNQECLLHHDMDAYARAILKLGEELTDHHVPLQEIIASLHLFEEAAQSVFPEGTNTTVYNKFDKLSHIRIILLVDSYSRSQWASVTTRIHALELEAKCIPAEERTRFHGLVGKSPAMRNLYQRIEAVGRANAISLVVGESGTGKELVARAIHECGPNPNAPFVPLNCAAMPRELIESELFGYQRGAFSGATAEYLGLFRSADGGTLFLDEITEMHLDTQSKLLRAIQERRVRPVGATTEVPVSVRVIASTNRDPDQAMQERQFRPDLYYRLQANILKVPPLRERIDDIALLVEHFVDLFNQKSMRTTLVAGIEDGAMAAFRYYQWPGNVREISNAIEGAFIFGRNPTIELSDLPPSIGSADGQTAHAGAAAQAKVEASAAVGTFADSERDIISRALEMADGNRVHAARRLGISRKRLYAKIRKYGLERESSGSGSPVSSFGQ